MTYLKTPAITLGRRPVAGFRHLQQDLSAPFQLPVDIECVVHAAGLAHVDDHGSAVEQAMFRVNRQGTRHLLNALPSPLRSFVLISTVAVYGREDGLKLDESTPCLPQSAYGRSKLAAEELCRDHFKNAPGILTILRLPLVVGSDAPGNFGSMVRGLASGRYLGIGSGQARRSMVWAEDVAKYVATMRPVGGVFHLTDGINPSFRQLEAAICQALGRRTPKRLPLSIARIGGWCGDALNRVTSRPAPLNSNLVRKMTATLTFDDERARTQTGWNPTPVLEAIPEILEPWSF